MKTSTLLKSLSAVGILGTAVLSMNANAEGGCPNGSYPTQGAGWRGCTPVYNNGGSSTPSRSSDDEIGSSVYRVAPPTDKERQEYNAKPVIVYKIDKNTQQVAYKITANGNKNVVAQEFNKQCVANNQQCNIDDIPYNASKTCATLKQSSSKEFISPTSFKRKVVTNYELVPWYSEQQKVLYYSSYRLSKGTYSRWTNGVTDVIIKDMCF